MTNELSDLKAFNAMVKFLEKFYERTSSDDVGALLSDLLLLDDKKTADPAAWPEWVECIKEVLQKNDSL